MEIITAKTAGFCMGVKRAVDIAIEAAENEKSRVYTYGPLIHNPQVLEFLRKKGLLVLSEIPEKASGTVIIRAHGVPPSDKEKLKKAGFKVIDATCPYVLKVQNIIDKHRKKGYASIIIGDKEHPEVIGLIGFAGKNAYVVKSRADLKDIPFYEKIIITAQTTQDAVSFAEIAYEAEKKFPDIKIFDTICTATSERQEEIKKLSENADITIIVGGRNSGNTCRLAEIAAKAGKPYFHIETKEDLDLNFLTPANKIAITAGASTPNWLIEDIRNFIEKNLP